MRETRRTPSHCADNLYTMCDPSTSYLVEANGDRVVPMIKLCNISAIMLSNDNYRNTVVVNSCNGQQYNCLYSAISHMTA